MSSIIIALVLEIPVVKGLEYIRGHHAAESNKYIR